MSPQMKHVQFPLDSRGDDPLSTDIRDANNHSSGEGDNFKEHKSKRIIEHSHYSYIALGDFRIVWMNVVLFIILNMVTLYSYYRIFWRMHLYQGPMVLCSVIAIYSGIGITAGAHRLWAHRSYKAKLPLRIFLMIGQTIAGQNCVYTWCRDHRMHHKFSETDADPHNTKRGFFFAHIGWLLRKKHPDVIKQSEKLDFSDLLADPVVKFQNKYWLIMYLLCSVALPLTLLYFSFNMSLMDCLIIYIARYIISLHITWFINSTAHMYGPQPYSKDQEARENSLISFGALGEGYHNYHHTFPQDYKTAESGMTFNVTKHFIDLMAYIGQAYDLKSASPSVVESCKANAGKLL